MAGILAGLGFPLHIACNAHSPWFPIASRDKWRSLLAGSAHTAVRRSDPRSLRIPGAPVSMSHTPAFVRCLCGMNSKRWVSPSRSAYRWYPRFVVHDMGSTANGQGGNRRKYSLGRRGAHTHSRSVVACLLRFLLGGLSGSNPGSAGICTSR